MNSKQMLLIAAVAAVAATGTFALGTIARGSSFALVTPAEAADSELMVAGPLGEKTMGDPKAPNVVIEYASLTCTHCQKFHEDVFTPFKQKYIDTGKVYFIYRSFPLNTLDKAAIMIANCAPPERFFPIVKLLYDQQPNWAFVDDPATALQNTVKQAGFSEESFKACLSNQKVLDGITEVMTRGEKLGVDATPTFFFNGEKKSGELTLEEIDKILGG